MGEGQKWIVYKKRYTDRYFDHYNVNVNKISGMKTGSIKTKQFFCFTYITFKTFSWSFFNIKKLLFTFLECFDELLGTPELQYFVRKFTISPLTKPILNWYF